MLCGEDFGEGGARGYGGCRCERERERKRERGELLG